MGYWISNISKYTLIYSELGAYANQKEGGRWEEGGRIDDKLIVASLLHPMLAMPDQREGNLECNIL